MIELTKRQKQVLEFIRQRQAEGFTPSFREIAGHFGFGSMNAAVSHVQALRRKGLLKSEPRRARSLQIVPRWPVRRQRIVDIPVFGAIPAGFAEDREQDVRGCISVDERTLGARPTSQVFALRVQGDSMMGRGILDGDIVILDHGLSPKHGDVVAALIDGESTLKTFAAKNGRAFLRAENPRYPELIPASELVTQGVMIALVRQRQ